MQSQKFISPDWVIVWGTAARSPSPTWASTGLALLGVEPTFSPSQRFVLVGDCCFDRPALKHLAHRSLAHRSLINVERLSDLAIVGQLWEEWGSKTLSYLDGQFALAVWDQDQQTLHLGRDRVGAKTLYYTRAGKTRWIAPRLRSLNPYHAQELDPIALRDYLCCAFVPGAQTLWQGVRELRPGSYLQLPAQPQRYWQPQEQVDHADRPLEWHAQQVRSLLEQLVQQALPPGEPVGTYLSGGIDSSCVTAIAARRHDHPVHTFSMHFGAQYPSELEFANQVAAHCGTQHHVLEVSPQTIWQLLPETLAVMDDPVGEGLTVPNLLLARSARQFVGVVLNGEGGDPCFAGPKNKPMLLNSLYGSMQTVTPDPVAAYLASFQKCFVDLPRLLQPDLWDAVKDQPSAFAADLQKAEPTLLNRLMLLNIEFKGADYILTKVNNLTAAAGLEGRSPLFHPRMVELSLQIPPEYKLLGAQEKAVLKAAVADLLPDSIINRPKSGMVMSMQQWFLTHWQRQARSLLLNRRAAIAPYLNQALIRDWLSYRGEVFPRYGLKLWLLVTLETWLQVNRR